MHSHPPIAVLLLCACSQLPGSVQAQQPQLSLLDRAFSRAPAGAFASLSWTMFGRPGNVCVLLADLAPGQSSVLGQTFDLAFTPSMLVLDAGVLAFGTLTGNRFITPSSLPAGAPIFLQFGEWDAASGFATLRASNVDSLVAHDGVTAIVADFASPGAWPQGMTGVFDHTVANRLQALPPSTRVAHPLPPQAYPYPTAATFEPLHPSGSRFQLAFRAEDLGANGLPETLTGVRWRPLFGAVTATTHPQFELLAAHCNAVPDYSIDPWSALPSAPTSGLSNTYASNPIAGSQQTVYSGPYSVQPGSLQANGYLPFPTLQQGFAYDGVHTLLLETRCAASPGLGTPLNHQVLYLMVPTSPDPFALVYACGGVNGVPVPLQPTAATAGQGGSFLYDWELEFVRTTSLATSQWMTFLPSGQPPSTLDYQTPILAGFTPPGTSLQVEFRGAVDANGTGATGWSTNQDIADGKPYLQFRVRMTANAVTGAVPWLDTLIVPAL